MRRRFRRPPHRALAILLVLVVLAIVRYFHPPATPPPNQPLTEGVYEVVRVVDGDTLIVAPHRRVRLIGVNAPETVKPEHPIEPWGPEAGAFAEEFLSGGQARLTFDRELVDQYGRFLAYVWVEDKLLNEELVRRGMARFEPQYNYAEPMKRRFRAAQQQAKREHVGIWSNAEPKPK